MSAEKQNPPLQLGCEYQSIHKSKDCQVMLAVRGDDLAICIEDQPMPQQNGAVWFSSASFRGVPIAAITGNKIKVVCIYCERETERDLANGTLRVNPLEPVCLACHDFHTKQLDDPNSVPDMGAAQWANDPRSRDWQLAFRQMIERADRLKEAIHSGSREGLKPDDLDW